MPADTIVVDGTKTDPSPVAEEPKPALPEDQLPADAKAETRERFVKLLDDRKSLQTRLKTYEALGSPEEIGTLREQVQEYEALSARIAALDAERDGGDKTNEQRQLERMRLEARKQLRELDEGIAKGEAAADEIAAIRSARAEYAWDVTEELMQGYDLGTSKAEVSEMTGLIRAAIEADPKLRHQFFFGNTEAAVQKGFDKVLKRFGDIAATAARKHAAKTQTDKEKLGALPQPHKGGGGGSGSHTVEAPQTVAEGVKRSLAILREQRG